MRKILLTEFGEPDVLRVEDHPEPEPPQDGYVVEMRAIGVNYADVVERRGLYGKEQRLPFPIGKEGSGVVVRRGPRATEFDLGDDVIVVRLAGGCYAERVALGPTEVLPCPRGWSHEDLAAFPICHATAWYGMHEIARCRPGETVLVQAAAGGVGAAAVQQALALGCRVLGTAGGPEKTAFVRELGATAFDYDAEDFLEGVLAATDGRGVDYCLESVGGEVFEKSLAALAPLGRLVIIGFSSISSDYAERIRRVHPLTVFHRSISLAGLNVHNLDFPARRAVWRELVAFAEQHDLRPVIGHRYPLEEAASAHAALEGRRTHGKVLLLL